MLCARQQQRRLHDDGIRQADGRGGRSGVHRLDRRPGDAPRSDGRSDADPDRYPRAHADADSHAGSHRYADPDGDAGGNGHADSDGNAGNHGGTDGCSDGYACARAAEPVCPRHQRRHAAARQPKQSGVSAKHPEQRSGRVYLPEPVCRGRHDLVSGAVQRPVGLCARRPRPCDGRGRDGGIPCRAGSRAGHPDPDAAGHA